MSECCCVISVSLTLINFDLFHFLVEHWNIPVHTTLSVVMYPVVIDGDDIDVIYDVCMYNMYIK